MVPNEATCNGCEDTILAVDTFPEAGRVLRIDDAAHVTYTRTSRDCQAEDNPYYPFLSECDYEIARWAIQQGPSQNAFSNFLSIDQVKRKLDLSYKNARALHQKIDHELPGVTPWRRSVIQISGINEEFELFMCDPVECIKELWANPAYLDHLTYAPEHRFTDEGKVERIYDELMSGDWSWEAQVRGFKCFFGNVLNVLQTLLPDGATLVPVILSSDKTQLCQFRGDKTAYPVYLTIGNISKSIRHKPSFHTQKLIGYLPTVSLDGTDISVDSARLTRAQLFHYAMRMVTSSLRAGPLANGIELISGDGAVRLGFPVLAAYVADYPEQALVTCTRYAQTCPKCFVTKDELGNHVTGDPRYQKKSIRTIRHASQQSTRVRADAAVRDHGLNLILDPFWIELLHCNIHDAITPDILHQIYQGLVRHLCGWISTLIGDAELDARFKRMPRAHGVRLFSHGISGLTQVSGPEHREICKQLLGCIVDAPGAPAGVICATRSLLDFLEIAQYQSHTEATLGYLASALDEFHANKDVFINLGARNSEDFNFAKLHSLEHYANSIRRFGTTDNYNTEATERLHIDYAKDAYRATNKKEFLQQMTRWLERHESMAAFDLVLQWRRGEIPKPRTRWRRPLSPGVYLAKNPSACAVPFHVLENQFGATHFKDALGEFIVNQLQSTSQHLEAVDVWYRIKFAVPNLQVDTEFATLCTAHAEPKRLKTGGIGELGARFDTVLINELGCESEDTGIDVARLKVIFRIPDEYVTKMSLPRQIGHLAYVEWFSRSRNKDSNSGMYPISRSYRNGVLDASVIEVDSMFRTCQLAPRFGRRANRAWTSNNVLDRCEHFLINNFIDHHTYQSIW
ncbi:uncharacterized protein F5891DRAFT_962498 [Suillus fuscotomentosus]|uniref:Uncharacterized protein n=1 Tax=Suillus fuscotomentosus TaxID=1912939 RepID=A0AAD4DTY4_9AGAM|nr:uncharacterized protein F5891DRAFT_962498 [Suillus fuscotomentosus]KAG1893739.1 hypothetical protein F5891DRAFT_962498 [Suillus fuscotomentosus]